MRKFTSFMFVIVALFMLAGCAGKSQNTQSFQEFAYGDGGPVKLSASQHEQVADSLIQRGEVEMAFVHYNQALAADPENINVRIKKGELLVREGLEEQALAEFMQVLQREPENATANGAAGAVYFRVGLYAEARTHLEKAVAINPMLWNAHSYLGILNDRAGKYDQAVADFTTALGERNGADAAEIYNNLGVVYIALKQYDNAVESFRNALKNGGVSALTYNNLGLALTRLGRLDEALESFKYAGGESKANNNLGYVLLTDDQPERAIPYFEQAIELSSSFYVKAAENLKRARLAARFQKANTVAQTRGSTPNPLLRQSFPDAEQNPGGPAASPASAGPPPSLAIQKISREVGSGDTIHVKTYGLHVSSWRDHANAFDQCAQLKKQGYSTWINQVDLGEKGVWYRVLVGEFTTVKDAQAGRQDVLSALKLDRAPIYERTMPIPAGTPL